MSVATVSSVTFPVYVSARQEDELVGYKFRHYYVLSSVSCYIYFIILNK